MGYEDKPVWAIKFRNYCANNNIKAKDLVKILDVSISTVYKYWSGKIAVPDDKKKILKERTGMNIYEVFYNEEL